MLVSQALVATSKSDWIIDLGASSHMCSKRAIFKDFVEFESAEKVSMGDGSTLDVKKE